MARREAPPDRLTTFLLVASILHATSLGVARLLAVAVSAAGDRASSEMISRRSIADEDLQEVTLLEDQPIGEQIERRLAVHRAPEVERSSPPPARSSELPSSRSPREAPGIPQELSREGVAGVEAPSGSGQSYRGPAEAFSTGRPLAHLPGLGGAPVWMLGDPNRRFEGPAPAPTTAPKRGFDPHAGTRALEGTMLGLDAKKGILPPATTLVAAALKEAAMQTPMPAEARAQFAVAFAADGTVSSIRITSFSAGRRSAWEALTRLAFGKVAGKPLDVGRLRPPFSFAIRFTTDVLYPSGAKEPTEMVDVGASPRQVVHAFVELRGAGATALPAETPSQKERGPWNRSLPKGVMPVELNPDKH